ncbi:hypothetical protein, partial [Ligilactobacillus murinus]|uniref:hypothetical protein n=1 Tax=Ligilactobacillus murinus TaxID=1622 RepID=UPI001C3F55FD
PRITEWLTVERSYSGVFVCHQGNVFMSKFTIDKSHFITGGKQVNNQSPAHDKNRAYRINIIFYKQGGFALWHSK